MAVRRPFLPQELVDETIAHLRDDRDALRQCSLVCHAWLPSISRYLFRNVRWPDCAKLWYPGRHSRLESRPLSDREAQCRCPTSAEGTESLRILLGLITTSPRIYKNVKELSICGRWSSNGLHVYPKHFRRHPVTPSEVMDVLEALPNARCLYLKDVEFFEQVPCDSREAIRDFDQLVFQNSSPYNLNLSLLLRVIRYFRQLDTLDLENVVDEATRGHYLIPPSSQYLPCVRRLSLMQAFSSASPAWLERILCNHIDLTALTSLSILPPSYPNNVETFASGLHALLQRANNLQRLTTHEAIHDALLARPTTCPALRYLCLEVFSFMTPQLPSTDRFARIADILDSSVCSHIEDVHILCVFEDGSFGPGRVSTRVRISDAVAAFDLAHFNNSITRLKSLVIDVELDCSSCMDEKDAKRCRAVFEQDFKGRLPSEVQDITQVWFTPIFCDWETS